MKNKNAMFGELREILQQAEIEVAHVQGRLRRMYASWPSWTTEAVIPYVLDVLGPQFNATTRDGETVCDAYPWEAPLIGALCYHAMDYPAFNKPEGSPFDVRELTEVTWLQTFRAHNSHNLNFEQIRELPVTVITPRNPYEDGLDVEDMTRAFEALPHLTEMYLTYWSLAQYVWPKALKTFAASYAQYRDPWPKSQAYNGPTSVNKLYVPNVVRDLGVREAGILLRKMENLQELHLQWPGNLARAGRTPDLVLDEIKRSVPTHVALTWCVEATRAAALRDQCNFIVRSMPDHNLRFIYEAGCLDDLDIIAALPAPAQLRPQTPRHFRVGQTVKRRHRD